MKEKGFEFRRSMQSGANTDGKTALGRVCRLPELRFLQLSVAMSV